MYTSLPKGLDETMCWEQRLPISYLDDPPLGYSPWVWVQTGRRCAWTDSWMRGQPRKNDDNTFFIFYFYTARSQVCPVLRKTGTHWSEDKNSISFCSIPGTASACWRLFIHGSEVRACSLLHPSALLHNKREWTLENTKGGVSHNSILWDTSRSLHKCLMPSVKSHFTQAHKFPLVNNCNV